MAALGRMNSGGARSAAGPVSPLDGGRRSQMGPARSGRGYFPSPIESTIPWKIWRAHHPSFVIPYPLSPSAELLPFRGSPNYLLLRESRSSWLGTKKPGCRRDIEWLDSYTNAAGKRLSCENALTAAGTPVLGPSWTRALWDHCLSICSGLSQAGPSIFTPRYFSFFSSLASSEKEVVAKGEETWQERPGTARDGHREAAASNLQPEDAGVREGQNIPSVSELDSGASRTVPPPSCLVTVTVNTAAEQPHISAPVTRSDLESGSGSKGLVLVKECTDARELSSRKQGVTSYNSCSGASSEEASGKEKKGPGSSTGAQRATGGICTYCSREIRDSPKITLDHLGICCHDYCFKCGICSKPMGELLDQIFIHRDTVHCEKCYEKLF